MQKAKQLPSEGLKKIFELTITKEDLQKKEEEELVRISKKADLKGFRKGKVPTAVIKQYYGESVLVKAFEELMKTSLLSIYNDFNIAPATQPKIEIISGDPVKLEDVKVKVELDVMPEMSDIKLENITLNKVELQMTDEDLSEILNRLASNYFEYEDIKEERPLQEGDVANIDFAGFMDDKQFEGGTAQGFNLELGSNSFIDGFEEKLIGAKVGEELEIHLKFPQEYPMKPEYAGKDVMFKVKVNGIKKKVPTAIEDLPKKVGFSDLEALKKDITKRYSQQYDHLIKRDLKNQLFENLSKLEDFELPASLVDAESSVVQNDYKQYKEIKAANPDEVNAAYDGKSEEEVVKEQEEFVKNKVKTSLLLSEIIRKNNLKVTDEDVHSFIKQEVAHLPEKQAREVANSYINNPAIVDKIRAMVAEDKIVDFALSKVTLNTKTLSVKEFDDYLKNKD